MDRNKVKFRKRIGTKLFLLTFVVIVVTVAVTATTQHLGTKEIVHLALKNNATAAMTAIHNKIDSLESDSLKMVQSVAADSEVSQAVESGDADSIRQTVNHVVINERSNVEFVTVADKQGVVLARTHSDNIGDSVAAHQNFVGAQSGRTASYVEPGTAVKLSVISSSPIKNEKGEIIGTVALGYQLDNPALIDELKSMTGADITIFLGDERINTTIIKDGERQIGTKLSPAVSDIVLNQRHSYSATTTILDRPYYAVYDPIITDGRVIGIYFAGVDISAIKEAEKSLIVTELSVVIGVTVIMLLINFLVSRRMIINPVLRLSSAMHELANGKLNLNLYAGTSNDEIGQLTESVLYVADVLRNLILEMQNMASRHAEGETDAVINESGYQGAYKDVAMGTNAMVDSYLKHMRDFCDVLQSFGEGDFNAVFAKLPGKKYQANVVIEGVRRKLRAISSEIDTLAIAALEGRLDVRADTESFHGDWLNLLVSLNSMMDAVIAPINEASVVLGKMADGRLDTRITGDYKGDFEIVKLSVNKTQQAISSYINEISATLSEMSAQNLDVGINRRYIGDFSVIRDSINNIIASFNKVLAGVSASAEQVSTGARHISESSATLAQGASEQSSAVEELNAVIDQVASQTAENAETAQKANDIAQSARERAEEETVMMDAMMKAMEEINESSINIARVIKVIDDIAFQTNLLALNASVEAARAGELGKGFAVVAEEVRTLASRSKEAASETEALIETARKSVEGGVTTAGKTSEGLEAIVGMITEVTQHVKEIAKASAEQHDSITQVNIGISQVSQVTHSNSAVSEESAAAAEELSSMADMLHNTVAGFKLKG